MASGSDRHPSAWARRPKPLVVLVEQVRDPAGARPAPDHSPVADAAIAEADRGRWSSGNEGASVGAVRCPTCSSFDDKVVDSRVAEDGSAIRRRRECVDCGHRYTTFERVEEIPLLVIKRSGDRVPFDRSKIEAGVLAAAKGRPVDTDQMALLAVEIEETLRMEGPEASSERIGLAVLDCLRDLDQVAYVRFASVYKDFDDPADFQHEIGLLTKQTAPKPH